MRPGKKKFCTFSKLNFLSLTLAGGLCEHNSLFSIGFKIDFLGNCMAESTTYFFVIILKCIFTALFEIKIIKK